MPFRERVKKAFGGRDSPLSTVTTNTTKSSDSSPSSITTPTTELKHVETQTSLKGLRKITSRKPKRDKKREEDEKWKNWPENIYKPHEMPAPRYKRTPDPRHKQNLEAYSWDNAFATLKRKSIGSLYSPMGSRLPSRIGSIASRRSGRRSAAPSRSQSVAEMPDEEEAAGTGELTTSTPLGRRRVTNTYKPPSTAPPPLSRQPIPHPATTNTTMKTSTPTQNPTPQPPPAPTATAATNPSRA